MKDHNGSHAVSGVPFVLPRWKRMLFRAFEIALAVLVAAVLLEIALRVSGEAVDAEQARHAAICASRVPQYRDGRRDFNYALTPPPGVYRTVCTGDSFTYGMGVYFDDSYPKRLERKLNVSCPGRRFEVLNHGRRGAEPEAAAMF